MKQKFYSILELAEKVLSESPEKELFTFVNIKGEQDRSMKVKELHQRAGEIAYSLVHEHGLKKGDRAILNYPPGLEFVEAFIACLFAGVIPVPVAPPMPLDPEKGLLTYTQIATDSQARVQLTSKEYEKGRTYGRIKNFLNKQAKWPKLPWIITDKISGNRLTPQNVTADQIAFLQYTSGSTRAPRGVCITYENLWAQVELLKHETYVENAVSVFWMPHYHDFALIGCIIYGFCGFHHSVLFSPLSFLRRPSLWGELMSRYKATHTGGPDFGYKLLTEKSTDDEVKSWDFSSLHCAITAAEPVRPKTLDDFYARFSPQGLRKDAICPTYGLAEHTIAVSLYGKKRWGVAKEDIETLGEPLSTRPESEIKSNDYILIGCGKPAIGVEVKIVHPNSYEELGDSKIGEIWVRSLNKASGYFNQQDQSSEKFNAQIKGQTGAWLRTGDLGLLIEGEIVVTGRYDDMMTLGGRNLYPQDAEDLALLADKRIKPGRVLAFSKYRQADNEPGEDNQLFLVLELREDHHEQSELQSIAQRIKTLILQEMGLGRLNILFAKSGQIPKTTSGKLQRGKCRQLWNDNQIDYLYFDQCLQT
jgi:acyl-CoA synthetase (AMP-forming)/AMP-acid ligase II